MNKTFPTKDIKLASCLLALGIPYRKSDPVTREAQDRNGRAFDQYTFWFDIGDETISKQCGQIIEAYDRAKSLFLMDQDGTIVTNSPADQAAGYTLGIEHPLYYMMGVLFNRETWLHWMRANAEPMKLIQDGNRTVMLSTRATQELKDKIKKHLN